jgi:hypothetical protein
MINCAAIQDSYSHYSFQRHLLINYVNVNLSHWLERQGLFSSRSYYEYYYSLAVTVTTTTTTTTVDGPHGATAGGCVIIINFHEPLN